MQKTFSFKISEKTKDQIIEHFQDKKREKTPPYAIFQANEEDTVVTLYESGKIVFQGMSADIDASMWSQVEQKNSGKNPLLEEKKKDKKEKTIDKTDYYFISSIGSDEVGTGDYFGPVVVSAAYVSKKDISFLENLGVRDSKKTTDEKVLKIAPEIIKRIPYVSLILNNKEYNDNYNIDINMNKIKAVLHNKALYTLLNKEKFIYDLIVVDQFAKEKVYYSYLKDAKYIVKNITFTTKAEDKCLSVACASIISRYIFLKEMDKISNNLKIEIPKGASTLVDEVGVKIVEKYGKEKLKEIAKLNFKNTNKILKENITN